jgi:hypothetical protein
MTVISIVISVRNSGLTDFTANPVLHGHPTYATWTKLRPATQLHSSQTSLHPAARGSNPDPRLTTMYIQASLVCAGFPPWQPVFDPRSSGTQSGTRAGIFRVLQFPLPILIPPDASHPSATRGCTVVPLVASVSPHTTN